MQPGDTITPSNLPPADDKTPLEHGAEIVIPIPQTAVAAPQIVTQPISPVPMAPSAVVAPDAAIESASVIPPAPTAVAPVDSVNNNFPQQAGTNDAPPAGYEVRWSASEFIAHHKSASWFVGLGLVIGAASILVYVFSHDIVSPILITVMGIAFGVFATHSPRVLDYMVNDSGIQIGGKFYGYDNFKAFSMLEEGALHAIILAPLQRFMPPITVYYETADEDRIMNLIADYLPFEQAQRDSVESLMRRVRF